MKAVPRTFKCLACDSQAKLPAEELPVYCQDCYPALILEGYLDPTEDVALVHYLWHGAHLPGIMEETAERVVAEARPLEI